MSNARGQTAGVSRSGLPPYGTGRTYSMDVEGIAAQRINAFIAEAIRYWRWISSSGLLLAVVVLFILGMVYYDQMLAAIPSWLPMGLVYALFLSWLVSRAPQRHFLREADLLFLTPVESRMEAYFRKTYRYNLFLQWAGLGLTLILLYPVWRDLLKTPEQPVWAYFLIPILLKGWHFAARWSVLRHPDERHVSRHFGLRWLFHFLFLLWWFYQGDYSLLLIFAVGAFAFFLYERRSAMRYGMRWLRLLELEQKQVSRFYAFCQSFVDVPHMGTRVRRRTGLDQLTRLLPFHRDQAFRYLYLKTLLRAQDYLGIYLRLTLVGTLFISFLDHSWAKGSVLLLFLFAAATQLSAIWAHHRHQFWLRIWPVSTRQVRESFVWFVRCLLGFQAVIMWGAIFLSDADVLNTLILVVLSVLFILWYPARLGTKLSLEP